MNETYERLGARQHFEVGDEVIGDPTSRFEVRGTVIKVEDVLQPADAGFANSKTRHYTVQNQQGEIFHYTGETNLQLAKKAAERREEESNSEPKPPRAELLAELDEDLKRRPLVGLRF
ncbi:MAG: hypothetical protein JO270_08800 [Acidobacteriaceae bacterium]|nr:hypothetical protein [Acidobacteriaceae bacterium]MBV8571871.1 hypothetical protein [Acidobacteriaceae bacterium]